VLIPSRGPHLAPASGPALLVPGVETVSQPACRRGCGSRVTDGPAGRGVGNPSRDRPCRKRIGAQVAAGSPEAAWAPGHRRLRSEVTWIRTTAGSAGVERGRTATQARHRGATRGTDPMTGSGERRSRTDEVGVITTSTRRASWCSYHQVTFKPPPPHRLAGGRVGPSWNEAPHREATRGVGPVTGTAGSEGQCGRGGRHHFRLKAEGPL
jgi:hypothetical protein